MFFAAITSIHDSLAFAVTPCAQFLYRWLLRKNKPGKEIEFEIKDFQDFCEKGRGKGYSAKWVKNALAELVEIELVKIDKKYSGHCWKIRAYHPEKSSFSTGEKNSNRGSEDAQKSSKTSQNRSANPQKLVPYYIDSKENKQGEEPKKAASVVVENVEKPEREITPEQEELLESAEDQGVKMNPSLIALICNTAVEIVKNAISVLKKNRKEKGVKNPAGFLVEAIKGKWEVGAAIAAQFPKEFLEWYKSAISEGLVLDIKPQYLNKDSYGQLLVKVPQASEIAPYRQVPWLELRG